MTSDSNFLEFSSSFMYSSINSSKALEFHEKLNDEFPRQRLFTEIAKYWYNYNLSSPN